MSRVYATPEIKSERAFKRAEHLERTVAPRGWSTPGLTLGDLEVLADAWEEAGFLGWADNYRAEARTRRSARRDVEGLKRRKTCRGSGEHVGGTQGGARWQNRGRCRVCGKDLALTRSGRIPSHVPANRDPPASGVRPRSRGPMIESGYALARHATDPDADWEDVVVSASLNQDARFLGFRRIDGQEHAVWRVGPMFYAQTAVGPRHPSRFRR